MKNHALAVSGLVLVLLGLLATISLFVFEPGIRKLDWIDLEAAAVGSAVICLVGCALGWASFKTGTGKAAAILGSLLVLFFAYQFLRSDARSQPSPASLPNPPAQSSAGNQ
ncbi:MAG TPA: hypothetical protein VNA25_15765 [Phycisphaerae bacterium]|nr:hypothetical protein [Phycisphaerae bacterium]